MNRYEGYRTKVGPIVTVNGEPLDFRLDLRNHSPTGFEWGYCGSGPAQLALAILADHLESGDAALEFYQRFKWEVIVGLPRKRWRLTGPQIDQALEDIRRKEMTGGQIF
jgi:hypothetical protein